MTKRRAHTDITSLSRNEKLLADPARLRQISERIPAGRWGDPKDFAGPVVFLASRASQYVCGELLVVDGVRLISHKRIPLLTIYISIYLHSIGLDGQVGGRAGPSKEEEKKNKVKKKGSRFWRITEIRGVYRVWSKLAMC